MMRAAARLAAASCCSRRSSRRAPRRPSCSAPPLAPPSSAPAPSTTATATPDRPERARHAAEPVDPAARAPAHRPSGRSRSPRRVPKIRARQTRAPRLLRRPRTRRARRWQVSIFSAETARDRPGRRSTTATGAVLEAWTGYQVAWTMARGYDGAFGRQVNAWYVWIPLCVLFLAPFLARPAPPRCAGADWLHLDLLVLLGFSVSLAFFNARADRPLDAAGLPAARLPAGAHAARRRGRGGRRRSRCALLVPVVVAGGRARLPRRLPRRAERHELERHRRRLLGRDRRRPARCDGEPLYGDAGRRTTRPATRTAPSTTTPTCPFEQLLPWSGAGTTCPPRTPRRSSSTC